MSLGVIKVVTSIGHTWVCWLSDYFFKFDRAGEPPALFVLLMATTKVPLQEAVPAAGILQDLYHLDFLDIYDYQYGVP